MTRGASPPAARAPQRAAPDGLMVYALTTSRPRLAPAEGVRGDRLRMITAGGVAAIVGRPAGTPRTATRSLLRYAAIVEGLARQRPALLPARYGTVVEARELRSVLAARGGSLREALRHVRQRAQMNVHVVEPEDDGGVVRIVRSRKRRGAHNVARAAGDARGSGTAYLQARAEAAAREAEVAGFAPLRAAVQRWVRAERVEKQGGEATTCHLVPRGAVARYRRALERAAHAHGMTVRVSGPWAPYAFAEGSARW